MTPNIRLMCTVLFAGLLATTSVSVTAAGQSTAEEKAISKQMHAQRWLEVNRASLSQRQIDLVIEAISFVSADRRRNPQDIQARKYGDDLKRRLTCELGRAKVTAAFTFLDPPRQSVTDSADEWLAWFPDCLLRGHRY
jgi:hypothetical protein